MTNAKFALWQRMHSYGRVGKWSWRRHTIQQQRTAKKWRGRGRKKGNKMRYENIWLKRTSFTRDSDRHSSTQNAHPWQRIPNERKTVTWKYKPFPLIWLCWFWILLLYFICSVPGFFDCRTFLSTIQSKELHVGSICKSIAQHSSNMDGPVIAMKHTKQTNYTINNNSIKKYQNFRHNGLLMRNCGKIDATVRCSEPINKLKNEINCCRTIWRQQSNGNCAIELNFCLCQAAPRHQYKAQMNGCGCRVPSNY